MGSVILIKKGDSFNSEFVISLLKNKRFLTQLTNVSSASAQQAIYISHLKKLKITLPPLDLQNQFAERVAVIEEQKAIAQKSLEHSESLFNSLLQKAFKGELV
jgi:type I restriction enzyme S subunit